MLNDFALPQGGKVTGVSSWSPGSRLTSFWLGSGREFSVLAPLSSLSWQFCSCLAVKRTLWSPSIWLFSIWGGRAQLWRWLSSWDWLLGHLKRFHIPLLSPIFGCLWNTPGNWSSLFFTCLENLSRTCLGSLLGSRHSASPMVPESASGSSVLTPLLQGKFRICTHCLCPKKLATSMAEWPAWLVLSSLSPIRLKARTRNSTTWLCPEKAAYIRALLPQASETSGSALNCTRSLTTSRWPISQALLRAVRPSSSWQLTSAPFSSSRRVNLALVPGSCRQTAYMSGVRLFSVLELMMRPSKASRMKRARWTLPPCMASKKVLVPEPWRKSLGRIILEQLLVEPSLQVSWGKMWQIGRESVPQVLRGSPCVDSKCIYLRVRLREQLPVFLYLPLQMPSPRCLGNKRLRTIMQWQHPFSPSTQPGEKYMLFERNNYSRRKTRQVFFMWGVWGSYFSSTHTNLISQFLLLIEKSKICTRRIQHFVSMNLWTVYYVEDHL